MPSKRVLFFILFVGIGILAAVSTPSLSWSQWSGEKSSSLALSSERFSNEIEISTGGAENRLPAVAYNHREGEYLIVWDYPLSSSYRQILTRRLSRSGQLLDTPSALNTGSNCFQQAVAYNHTNNEYLVAWVQDPDGSGTKNEIWGRICQLRPDYGGCVNAADLTCGFSSLSQSLNRPY